MMIDWTHFTPIAALVGGLLIGLSATLLILCNGRIAGISGIIGGLLQRPNLSEASWRIAFVLGLVLAPTLYGLFAVLPASQIDASWLVLVVAGLLVGYGTRLGTGCTSGHGVCGLSRLAPRSLVATLTFMAAGFITVYVVHHVFA
ncbi:MAG TPA: YeeE/YedE thiosulfate transporter family protein [Candidatus Competibacteraceae bacterium]|nr:MAG: YeeE/YedE family protein [Candidatus Competibacteraceae bacterium]HOB61202.1 YeeE/YedE thiosulfate transporter family protein [Candidatus Competibacteraceae bacterium]HQA24721.1 YeeE/YedE thiosulfate transporter family protein [Candidatus Competibacteraceae bacterium]HQD55525.1 YeeE/YedE thiosulfate transporter family protein [Candidatus Competibacteraceae bacterium]